MKMTESRLKFFEKVCNKTTSHSVLCKTETIKDLIKYCRSLEKKVKK